MHWQSFEAKLKSISITLESRINIGAGCKIFDLPYFCLRAIWHFEFPTQILFTNSTWKQCFIFRVNLKKRHLLHITIIKAQIQYNGCHLILFCKIQARQWYCQFYLLWRPWGDGMNRTLPLKFLQEWSLLDSLLNLGILVIFRKDKFSKFSNE